jgi:formyltetrahydrofolate-dependent phosphoribosylglycinamide formyltransferase
LTVSRKRAAILISGRGSNMEALIEAAKDGAFPAKVVLVLSNKSDAAGLSFARSCGVKALAFPHKSFESREAHDAAIDAALMKAGAQLVCLAGYMRIMTPALIEKWAGRMINIHPSLLPAFPGLHTHERALEAGVAEHGCTVHFVTAGVDEGPVIAQARVPVLPGDTAEALGARVLTEEHKLYPAALRLVAEGGVRMEDGHAVFAVAP